ncbi:MAG: OmpA family protein [Elusimicrobia bacterium]|nr:OmpA family protein [Elusimicrobiota bacterium]
MRNQLKKRFVLSGLFVLSSFQLLALEAGGQEGELVSLHADERLTLDGDAVHNPVNFFIMQGEPPRLMFPVSQGALKGVQAWQIQIRNSDGRKVSFIQGTGAPRSPVIAWSGLSETGELLPDGFYDTQLVWRDADGLHETSKTKVSLLAPPALRDLARFQFKLDYTVEGLVVRIPEIMFFDLGQSRIRGEALPALRSIIAFLKSSPGNKVDIRGYTDSSGSLNGNMVLSRERAQAVLLFLSENGVDPERLTYKGLGPRQPIASNATEEGRAKNRRVEVVVLKASG